MYLHVFTRIYYFLPLDMSIELNYYDRVEPSGHKIHPCMFPMTPPIIFASQHN